MAATEALGFEVLPQHFDAGLKSVCFEVLGNAGFQIVKKGDTDNLHFSANHKDTWAEGGQRLVTHVRNERARGLSQAKKDAFRAEHGKLFCERCHLTPTDAYGQAHGDACIEVHHAVVQVAAMSAEHVRHLEDLQCLCANCHRVVHSELRAIKN